MTSNRDSISEVIRFTKMHGIGNDYIYIDCMESEPKGLASLAREMSDRHFGIGGDGIVLICPSEIADFKMKMFNNDGSEAKMCGNASRCIAKFVHSRRLTSKTAINLETLSGVKVLSLNMSGDEVDSVTVDMGEPILNPADIPVVTPSDADTQAIDLSVDTPSGPLKLTAVSMGNPHGVIFVDRIEDVDFDRLGPWLETHPMWPDRANIEFAQVIAPGHIRVRVWERGTGETLACGTGACAVAVAAKLTGRSADRTRIELRGGHLDILIAPNGHVMMTGPAEEVFTGTYVRKHTAAD